MIHDRLDRLEASGPFDEQKDVGFYREPPGGGLPLALEIGLFAFFFPWDAHKPCCALGPRGRVRKAVVKVAVTLS